MPGWTQAARASGGMVVVPTPLPPLPTVICARPQFAAPRAVGPARAHWIWFRAGRAPGNDIRVSTAKEQPPKQKSLGGWHLPRLGGSPGRSPLRLAGYPQAQRMASPQPNPTSVAATPGRGARIGGNGRQSVIGGAPYAGFRRCQLFCAVRCPARRSPWPATRRKRPSGRMCREPTAPAVLRSARPRSGTRRSHASSRRACRPRSRRRCLPRLRSGTTRPRRPLGFSQPN